MIYIHSSPEHTQLQYRMYAPSYLCPLAGRRALRSAGQSCFAIKGKPEEIMIAPDHARASRGVILSMTDANEHTGISAWSVM